MKRSNENERRVAFISWRYLALSVLMMALLTGALIAYRASVRDRELIGKIGDGDPPTCEPVALGISARIDTEIQNLKRGKMLFSLPQEMRVGNTERVEVRISKSFVRDLDSFLKQKGEAQLGRVSVGEYMGVVLMGTEGFFEIALKNHGEKFVADEGYADWMFEVTALRPGARSLYLTAYNVINTPDGARTYENPPFDQVVNVSSTLPHEVTAFIKNHWKDLFGLIIASGIIGLTLNGARKWKDRKRKKEAPSWERP